MADTGTLATAATASGSAKSRTKGVYTFAVDGDFTGGGSGALQMLGPSGGSSWITITDTTFSAAGAVNVELPSGQYRLLITGTVVGLTATLKEAGWQD